MKKKELKGKKKEWPDIIESTEEKSVLLNHKVVLTRKEFNNSPIAAFAECLLVGGNLPLDSAGNVRKYILEFEIVD